MTQKKDFYTQRGSKVLFLNRPAQLRRPLNEKQRDSYFAQRKTVSCLQVIELLPFSLGIAAESPE